MEETPPWPTASCSLLGQSSAYTDSLPGGCPLVRPGRLKVSASHTLDVITLLGLLSSFFACALTLLVNPSLQSDEHRELHLVTAVCVFLYQTLDNMDGKQARRTHSSSALGMFFDHGCDAINTTIISIPVAAALGTGWTAKCLFGFWCGYIAFYFQTWEEHYIGAMVLPVINGASEGLLILMTMCLCSYFYGANWWQEVIS